MNFNINMNKKKKKINQLLPPLLTSPIFLHHLSIHNHTFLYILIFHNIYNLLLCNPCFPVNKILLFTNCIVVKWLTAGKETQLAHLCQAC